MVTSQDTQVQSLSEFVKARYSPTDDQLSALISLEEFMAGPLNCFLLKGYAGTGKTFLTKCLVDFFMAAKKNVTLIAPTGRAARILQQKTGYNATTIHKGIYNLGNIDEIETHGSDKKKHKFRYNLNHIESNTQSIYIIDEASMITDIYSEDDFFVFGSGRLLKDMLDFVALNNKGRNDKLIFIGDDAQLPPVGDAFSPALSSSYLQQNYGIDTAGYELTSVVRQVAESGILANSINIRNLLKVKSGRNFGIDTNFPDISMLSNAKVVETYIQKNPLLNLSSAVVINHSNKTALAFNELIREKLFPGKRDIQVGDIMIIQQNNYNYDPAILNGMFVKVKAVSPVTEFKSDMKAYDANGKDCKITHVFRRVTLGVPFENEIKDVNCMILDSFLYSPYPGLDYPENISLYLDFKIRHPHLKPRSKDFGDALRQDPYFNAVKLKFGYAITCHKAQGGEWDSAIVNLDVNQSKSSDFFLRWAYTAITRASKELFIFNGGEKGPFAKLVYTRRLINETQRKTIHYKLPSNYKERLLQLRLDDAPQFLVIKFRELLARMHQMGVEIFDRKNFQFQEVYFFKLENKQAAVSFWYDGKGRFTRITPYANPVNSDELVTQLLKQLTEPVDLHLVDDDFISNEAGNENGANLAAGFEDLSITLKELYSGLKQLLLLQNIQIRNVRHLPFLEQYQFVRGNEEALVNFYYDNGNNFTKAEPDLANCNSNELLNSIEAAVDMLKEN